VLCVVISDPAATHGIIKTAREKALGLHIVVRTRFLGEIEVLRKHGASDVIPEELESAVEIFARVLTRYLVPRADIERFVNEVRSENYAMIRSLNLPGAQFGALQKQIPDLTVSAITVEPSSAMDGIRLEQAELRQKTGVTVMAVRREEEIFANPGGSFRLLAGDVAYVFASPEAMSATARLFAAPA
jgi:CPA2 family monovalent cation:H+ antiporter-2